MTTIIPIPKIKTVVSTYPVNASFDYRVKHAIETIAASVSCNRVSTMINSTNFEIMPNLTYFQLKMFCLTDYSHKEVADLIEKDSWKLGRIEHLFIFRNFFNPSQYANDPVIALGSSFKDTEGTEYFPKFRHEAKTSEKVLSVTNSDWKDKLSGINWFLAFR
jgi:hypothetical protein